MYDICLCSGNDCSLKKDCFRYTAEIIGRQDFFGTPPHRGNACEFFLSNTAQIELLAYQLWEADGRPIGTPEVYWFAAQKSILSRA